MLLAKVTPQRVVIDNVVAQRDCWAGGLASVSGPSSTARVCEGTEVLLATGRTGPPMVVAIGSEICVIASDAAVVAVIVAMIAGVQTLLDRRRRWWSRELQKRREWKGRAGARFGDQVRIFQELTTRRLPCRRGPPGNAC